MLFRARARQDLPTRKPRRHWKTWLVGSHNLRPLVIIVGVVFLIATYLVPPPAGLVSLLGEPKTGDRLTDQTAGYADYRNLGQGETIAEYYRARFQPPGMATTPTGFWKGHHEHQVSPSQGYPGCHARGNRALALV